MQRSEKCTTNQSTNITNLTFSDSASISILTQSHFPPSNGSFQPAEQLASSFQGVKVNGEWTIGIHESQIDNMNGRLLNLRLHFEVEYCTEGIQWSKLSALSNSCEQSFLVNGKLNMSSCPQSFYNNKDHVSLENEIFTPRHLHTAIGARGSIYVIGGYAHRKVEETWQFNYKTRKWTQLHGVHKRPRWYGQMAALTPFGMITYGGIKSDGQSQLEDKMFLFNPLNKTLSVLKTESK